MLCVRTSQGETCTSCHIAKDYIFDDIGLSARTHRKKYCPFPIGQSKHGQSKWSILAPAANRKQEILCMLAVSTELEQAESSYFIKGCPMECVENYAMELKISGAAWYVSLSERNVDVPWDGLPTVNCSSLASSSFSSHCVLGRVLLEFDEFCHRPRSISFILRTSKALDVFEISYIIVCFNRLQLARMYSAVASNM